MYDVLREIYVPKNLNEQGLTFLASVLPVPIFWNQHFLVYTKCSYSVHAVHDRKGLGYLRTRLHRVFPTSAPIWVVAKAAAQQIAERKTRAVALSQPDICQPNCVVVIIYLPSIIRARVQIQDGAVIYAGLLIVVVIAVIRFAPSGETGYLMLTSPQEVVH